MRVRKGATSRSLLLTTGALVIGLGAGAFLLFSVLGGEEAGSQDEDFARNSEFFRRGRPDFALCVSDYTGDPLSGSELSARLKRAVDHNKANLWKNSFLEVEDIKVESPCPKGPPVSENTADVNQYLLDIDVVDQPGPYVMYVHVVDAPLLATLDRLNLGRIMPQEYIDPNPNQPAGYEQVASSLFLSRDEFEQPDFLARQVAEALGCTELCARGSQPDAPGAPPP